MLDDFKMKRDKIGGIWGGSSKKSSIYGIDSFIDQQSAAASVSEAFDASLNSKSLKNRPSTNRLTQKKSNLEIQYDQ